MALRLVPLLLLVLLTGCATRPPVTEPAPERTWLEHRERVQAVSEWQVSGRVAIRNQDEGWHANFDWQQDEQRYRIRLRGPFGQGAVELQADGGGVWLKRQDAPPVYARNADQLLVQETGWQLPVAGLGSWLRGLPDGVSPARLQWDANGLLTDLEQNGWQIEFGRYRAVDGLQLPDRLQLKRDQLRVKVVVDSWQAP